MRGSCAPARWAGHLSRGSSYLRCKRPPAPAAAPWWDTTGLQGGRLLSVSRGFSTENVAPYLLVVFSYKSKGTRKAVELITTGATKLYSCFNFFLIFKNAIISEPALSKQSYGFDYMEHSGRRFHSENNLNATAENRDKREETHPELLRCGLWATYLSVEHRRRISVLMMSIRSQLMRYDAWGQAHGEFSGGSAQSGV